MLSDIKEGDEVYVYGVAAGQWPVKMSVERTTATRIFVAGRAYTRSGKLVGGGLRGRIVLPSAGLEAALDREQRTADEREHLRRLAHRAEALAASVGVAVHAFKSGRTTEIGKLEAAIEVCEELVRCAVVGLTEVRDDDG